MDEQDASVPVHSVANFAAKAGALMLANGAAAAEVVQAMIDIAQEAGVANVVVDVTYTYITFKAFS